VQLINLVFEDAPISPRLPSNLLFLAAQFRMGQEASALPEGGGSTAERASPSTVASTSSSSQPDSVMTVATQPTSDEQLLNPEQLSALRYLSDLISKAEATAAAGGPVCADLPLLKYQYNEIRSTALAEQQERRFKAEQAEYQRRAMQLRQAYDTARTRTKRSDNGASNPAAKRSKRQAQEPVPATAMDISGTSYEAVVLSEQPKANPIVRATAVAASAPPAVQATIVHAVPAFAAAPASSGASSSSASAMSPSSFLTSSHSSCTSDASVDSGEGTRHHTPTYTAGTNEFVTPQQDQPSAGEVSAADLYPYTTANDPIFGEFVQFPSTPQWTEPNYGDGPLSPAPAWRESGQTFDDETLDEDDKVFMNELLNLPDDIVEEDSAGDSSTPVHRGLDAIERSQKFLSNYIQLGLAERIRADYESKRITAATARKLIVWALASLEPDDQTELITQFQRSIKLNDQETSFSSAAGTSVSHPAGAVHNPKTPDEGCIVLSLLPQVLAPPVVQPPPPPSASVSTTKYHVLPSTQHIDFSPGTSKMLTHCCSTPAERDPTAPPMPMLDLLASVGAFLSEMKEKIGIEMKPEMKVPELFGANVSVSRTTKASVADTASGKSFARC
jgi:hypothetical protein